MEWIDAEENPHLTQTYAGPIVRINPKELSIHDPDAYNEIYVTESTRRTEHYDAFCDGLNYDVNDSIETTATPY